MMHVSEQWFSHIRDGRKTVEGRKNSPTWAYLASAPPQTLDITNGTEHITRRVRAVRKYPSLREYLLGEGLARTLPGVHDLAAAEAVYLAYFDAGELARYGVLAIELE